MRKIIITLFTIASLFNAKAQNVGIGTLAPTTKLHVLAASNPLRLEGLLGGASTDSILTTDATGVIRKRTIANTISTSGWSLAGNAGTTIATQFLGTTDGISLAFRTNNVRSAFLDYDSSKRNNSFGNRAMSSSITGTGNNAFGFMALKNLTTGNNNSAFGDSAAFALTGGTDNVFIGRDAAVALTNGMQNVGIGTRTLATDGASNNNIAIGFRSMENTFNSDNIGIGVLSLNKNLSGSNSIAIGSNALTNYTGNTFDMAIGQDALSAMTSGTENLAYGYRAGFNLTTQVQNTLIGHYALGNVAASSASNNTMMGYQAGGNMTTGSNNVAIGYLTLGANFLSGSSNTFVGYAADGTLANASFSNSGAFGNGVSISSNNTYRVGNTSASSIGGQVGWTTVSDERVKINVKEDIKGLDFILALRPVSYNYNLAAIDKFYRPKQPATQYNTDNTATRFSGFLAQEVQKTASKVGYNFSGVDVPQNDQTLYGLRYAEFVVPLVKAVQELKGIIEKKQEEIDLLKTLIMKNK